MTDPVQPRPQPVVDIAGQLGGLTQAAFVACFVLINTIIVQGVTQENVTLLGGLLAAAVAAVAGLVHYVLSLFAAKKAAQHVTPLADPRDYLGRALEADVYGKHAAPVEEFPLDPAPSADYSPSMGPDLA